MLKSHGMRLNYIIFYCIISYISGFNEEKFYGDKEL